jgi:hypothetical protein
MSAISMLISQIAKLDEKGIDCIAPLPDGLANALGDFQQLEGGAVERLERSI